MAKFKHNDHQVIDVSIIGVLPEMNYRQDYGDEAELAVLTNSIATIGWLHDKSTKVVEATAEQSERAHALRTAEWDRMKDQAKLSPDSVAMLAAWEATYLRKGKLPIPTWVNIMTFRRLSILAKANYLRMSGQASQDADGKPLMLPAITSIPAFVQVFETPQELRIVQFQENTMDAVGKKKTTVTEDLFGLRLLFEMSEKSTDYERALGGPSRRTIAQKYLGILQCNRDYPELHLLERIGKQPTEPGYIPLDKLHKETMRYCGAGKLPKNPPADCTTPLQVLARHIDEITNGKTATSEPSWMAKDAIKTISKNFPSDLVKEILQAQISNSATRFDAQRRYSKVHNVLMQLQKLNVEPIIIEEALNKLLPTAQTTETVS